MTLDDAAIERLVRSAQAGDASAFGRLFDHYHLPIYRYVASRVRRPSDAEDLTQAIFVKALEALPRYEARGIPFGGWLFRLARNAVIDFVRTSHEHADLAQSADRAGTDAGPEELAVIRQEIEAVGTAMAALTDDQRDAIALRFLAGLSAREAAEAMGKQEGTVRGLQFRAIAAMRRQLGIEEPEVAQDGRLHRAPEGQLMDDEMLELTSRSDAEVVRRIEAFGGSPAVPEPGRPGTDAIGGHGRGPGAVDRDVRRGGRGDREGPGRSVRADPPSRLAATGGRLRGGGPDAGDGRRVGDGLDRGRSTLRRPSVGGDGHPPGLRDATGAGRGAAPRAASRGDPARLGQRR